MPVLFIGHGSPMNAIEDTEYSRAWGRSSPVAAQAQGCAMRVGALGNRGNAGYRDGAAKDRFTTSMDFPSALFEKQYPAPGSPELARMTQELLKDSHVKPDSEWGLDHGAWSVLCQMYPKADVPVVQLSLDRSKQPAFHYELGRELRGLRKKGVLIIGSGNIVHNLREIVWEDTAYDWALEFDAKMKELDSGGRPQGHH